MSSTQPTVNRTLSNEDMLDEIPESAVINIQSQVNNNPVSDSEDSFKSVENFEPVKLKFLRKFAKASGKIDRNDLEELLLQKVTESMVYRTKYAEIRVKLDMYEELIQRQRTRIELLEKQYTDLEVTHDRILTAMRENPQAPIEPLKIVRAVSCQVYQPTAEYVNLVSDPIVIGDSPKKKRTRRRNEVNMNGKGKKGKKSSRKEAEITINTSDSDDEEDLEVRARKETRSKGKSQDNPTENGNSKNRSASKPRDSTSTNPSENHSEASKSQTKSSETQVDLNKSQQGTSDLNSSRSSNDKTLKDQSSQKSLKNAPKPTENGIESAVSLQSSSKVDKKSSEVDKPTTSSSNPQPEASTEQAKSPKKRGRKRKATTILDLFEKRPKNSIEDPKETSKIQNSKSNNILSQTMPKNASKTSHESDSDNDVTIIEDDDEEPTTNRHQTSKSSATSTELDFELPRALEKLAKASKLIESKRKSSESKSSDITSKSKKNEDNSVDLTSKIVNHASNSSSSSQKDNITSKSTKNSQNGSQTLKLNKSTSKPSISFNSSPKSSIGSPESVSSSSPEPESSAPVQKSFKVPAMKPKTSKTARPGPKCSKLSNQTVGSESKSQESDKVLKVSDKLLNGPSQSSQNSSRSSQYGTSKTYYPPSASKVPPSPFSSTKKSSNLDSSFDSFNFSSCSSLDTLSAFKASANLVTSTPLKALDQGPAKTVKRTLDMNFNENLSSKVPKLPQRGPQLIHPSLKPSIPAPTIKVEKVNNGIRISWKIDNFKASDHADIQSYQIYAFEEMTGNTKISTDDWKLVGDVKALLLPMAVTLREFNEDQKFHFAIRAVDVHKRLGEFSQPKTWE